MYLTLHVSFLTRLGKYFAVGGILSSVLSEGLTSSNITTWVIIVWQMINYRVFAFLEKAIVDDKNY